MWSGRLNCRGPAAAANSLFTIRPGLCEEKGVTCARGPWAACLPCPLTSYTAPPHHARVHVLVHEPEGDGLVAHQRLRARANAQQSTINQRRYGWKSQGLGLGARAMQGGSTIGRPDPGRSRQCGLAWSWLSA
jgi:hypothetical protein